MEQRSNTGLFDIHAHLLPRVDDGSRSVEETCELIRKAKQFGFRSFFVTPHYSRRRGTEGLLEAFEMIKKEIKKQEPEVELYLGQETFYHESLAERLKDGMAFTLANSQYVLVEFDPSVSYQALGRAARKLTASGYIPIIAHVERYHCLREKGRLNELIRGGCLLQMNYDSLQGHWFSSETRWCRKQVKEKKIHFLGTDMHRTDFRPPEISKALKWLESELSSDRFAKITAGNARKVLNNEKIS